MRSFAPAKPTRVCFHEPPRNPGSDRFGLDLGAGVKTDSTHDIQPATTKEALDECWERMRGPRAPGVRSVRWQGCSKRSEKIMQKPGPRSGWWMS